MTDIHAIIAAVRRATDDENKTRYRGKPHLEIEAPKLQLYEFQGCPKIGWHSGLPNDFCCFSYSFDDNHCAAYVYVLDRADLLQCTVRVSNCDGAYYARLPSIPKSGAGSEIAGDLVDTLVAATEVMGARGTLKELGIAPRLLSGRLDWYSDGGL